MRITIINKFYPPDISPTGRLVESLAHDRARRGDDVTVVTSNGEYSPVAEKVASNAANSGVKELRLWSPRIGRTTLIGRLLEYATFFLLSCWKLAWLPKQDVVVVTTSPPWIAWAAILHKRLRGCEVVLWNMDSYPEVLEASGLVRRDGLLIRAMRWVNRCMFKEISHSVCLDAAMREMLCYRYSPPGQELAATVIPNWEPVTHYAVDVVVSHTTGGDFDPKTPDAFTVLYAGNMGAGHEFDTALQAAAELAHSGVMFWFNGRGCRASEIAATRVERRLQNVVMEDYKSHDHLLSLMGAADCALITLREDMLGVMSPSKLHANLAMGVPVLYIGPEGSNVDEAIRTFECGVSLRPGDAMGVVDFIARLMEDPDYHAQLASRARRAFLTAYCDHQTLPQFDTMLQAVTGASELPAARQRRAA